jgi:amino acid permease
VFFLVTTVGVSMVLKQLDLVIDLVGSVAVIPFMFVFPGLLAQKLDGQSEEVFSLKGKYNGSIMIGLGIVLACAGLGVTIAGLV